MMDFSSSTHRELTSNDDTVYTTETTQLINSLYINLIIFGCLLVVFEMIRHMKSIYMNRLTRKFINTNRVPPKPPSLPFGWVWAVMSVSEEDVLRMVGLDGYMLLRYLVACFRIASFFTFWGLIVMAPVYHKGGKRLTGWNAYTVGNIADNQSDTVQALWTPVVFCYLFVIFFCQVMYFEYKNFIEKRVQYLVEGDLDTQLQTYYTIMIEHIPSTLRSTPVLRDFFERLFPGDVHSVEIALDLNELQELSDHRRKIRDTLEKRIAVYHATHSRPTCWVRKNFYNGLSHAPAPLTQHTQHTEREDDRSRSLWCVSLASALGYDIYDAIEHYSTLLEILNDQVRRTQREFFQQRQKLDRMEISRLKEIRKTIAVRALETGAKQVRSLATTFTKHTKTAATQSLLKFADPLAIDNNNNNNNNSNNNNNNSFNNSSSTRSNGSSRGSESSQKSDEHTPINGERRDEGAAVKGGDFHLAGRESEGEGEAIANPLNSPPPRSSASSSSSHSQRNVVSRDSGDLSSSMKETPRRPSTESKRSNSNGANINNNNSTNAITASAHKLSSLLHREWEGEEVSLRAKAVLEKGAKMVGSGVEGLAMEGLKTAEYATQGALRGVLEATRALELLTIGAYYKISSTAFVTFKSRVAKCSSQQMLLSHDYHRMDVLPAPNPKDIIWENVSIPQQQIKMRTSIADGTLVVGALFWSIVVAFISAVSSMESISQEIPALQEYSNTELYKLLNNYLAILLLLILLSLLPFVFDFISRSYEGLKLESEIQNSIMTRYFYYQLANVFVAVGLGSVANSLHQILQSPTSILSILGNSVPSFSIYFATLIITRTFTGVPIEMLRIFPLLEITAVKLCRNKKKCTRRELRNGAFADPPMDYGWIYPNILMVLMIMVTYCCIAPLIMPLCMIFFYLVYLMYKYQLLYIFINAYQSGGFMWYAVFDRSMLALVCGVFTLLCYLAIRQAFLSGPFYAILPLPAVIMLFWRHCNAKFKVPAKHLSLERAIEIDKAVKQRAENGLTVPHDTFSQTLFRQPALAEGKLKPAPYRSIARRGPEDKRPTLSSSSLSARDAKESDVTGVDLEEGRPSISVDRTSCLDRDFETHYGSPFDEDDLEDHDEREAAVDALLEDTNDESSSFMREKSNRSGAEGDPISAGEYETKRYGSVNDSNQGSSLQMKTFR